MDELRGSVQIAPGDEESQRPVRVGEPACDLFGP
jgi:hypothetical protein